MGADISALAGLQAGDPLDWAGYADAKEAPPLPAKGRYVVRAPAEIKFSATQAGFLKAEIDPVIIGPSASGYALRFTSVSAKPFKRGGVNVSQAGDYLRATRPGVQPRTPQEIADEILATAGSTYQVDVDWEAYDKESNQTVLKGMERFPKDPSEPSGHSPWITVEGAVDGQGNPRKIKAKARVTRFVPLGA
jgi:hypothetical protein